MKFNFLSDMMEKMKDITQTDIDKLKKIILSYESIILLGNGGSNSIASHISQDYTKFLKKKAFCFSDPSRLTCYINDYGMENAYKIFLEEFVDKNTLVILISSGGESKNIYNCCKFCKDNQVPFIILTGFEKDNCIRKEYSKFSILEFWIDSKNYGIVECGHQIILHSVL